MKDESTNLTMIFKEWLVAGSANAITSSILNPLDVIKTRMQITSNSNRFNTGLLRSTFNQLYKEGGIIGLYKPGLTASIIREMLNSGIRSGLYIPLRNHILVVTNSKDDNNLLVKILSAMTTGVLGSILANPIDVVKVRLMINPSSNSTYGIIKKIYINEGVYSFYKGLIPSTLRASSIAAGELACYDYTKHYLKLNYNIKEESLLLHCFTSLITGLVAATSAAPFDVIKTRAMNSVDKKSSLEILITLIKEDGLVGLSRGWITSYFRLAPHAIICFPLFEQLRKIFDLNYI